jgi:hypothetical protein
MVDESYTPPQYPHQRFFLSSSLQYSLLYYQGLSYRGRKTKKRQGFYTLARRKKQQELNFLLYFLPDVGSSKKIMDGFDASSTAIDNLNEKKDWERL